MHCCAGTLLGGNCSSSRLNVTNAQAGTFIQGTQLQIQLFTPVASGGNWTVSLQQGNTSAPWVTMGNMLLVSGGAGNATWAFVVNGSFVQQPGPYWIKAEHPTVPAGGVMNSPAMLTALPGGPVVNTSRLTVDLPANMTTGMLGMTVVVRIAPRDIGGAPTTDAVAMDVVVVGEAGLMFKGVGRSPPGKIVCGRRVISMPTSHIQAVRAQQCQHHPGITRA